MEILSKVRLAIYLVRKGRPVSQELSSTTMTNNKTVMTKARLQGKSCFLYTKQTVFSTFVLICCLIFCHMMVWRGIATLPRIRTLRYRPMTDNRAPIMFNLAFYYDLRFWHNIYVSWTSMSAGLQKQCPS